MIKIYDLENITVELQSLSLRRQECSMMIKKSQYLENEMLEHLYKRMMGRIMKKVFVINQRMLAL